MRRPINLISRMSQSVVILSLVLMFSVQTLQQCPDFCECGPDDQGTKCYCSHDGEKYTISLLKKFQSIDTLRLKNFVKVVDKNVLLEVPTGHLIISDSDINTMSIVLNGNKNINRLTLINIMGITEAWDWGKMLDQLIQVKDFRVENSSLNSLSIIKDQLKAKDMLSISLINCGITSINSNVINKWSNLKMISLAHNKISDLNRNWFPLQLDSLWSLDLSYNSISNIPKDFFDGMTALKKLRLDNNSFHTLCDQWFDPIWTNLHELWIDQNIINCTIDLIWITNVSYAPIFFNDGVCYSNILKKMRHFHTLRIGDEELTSIGDPQNFVCNP